ncbi:CCAAT-BINDING TRANSCRIPTION FACTOR-RELATED [Salix viminalis]|uniref:CCAAT-BINDING TRANSCRIPTION FACTOR-RELATED n=1 Tax=Salix viminalis TaxID=40686 RepID=A0A9Q0ZP02_SALVM|nr:CCAAT-BINDING TRANSCRIPTION FACTOR-RELATED [Salix viminalis]
MDRRGGFHGYHKLLSTSSSEMINFRLAAEINHSTTTNSGSSRNGNVQATTEDINECTVREQDRFMPIANVIRIMRKILPSHAKISDDAKETIQECVSEFISFITSEANERCQREQRKTVTAEDVLYAMSKLGFDDYIEPLTIYLHRYRDLEGDRGSVRGDQPLVRTRNNSNNADQFGAMAGAGSYAPAFHVSHHHHGFFGGSPIGAAYMNMMRDASSNASSSHAAALANVEAFAHHK